LVASLDDRVDYFRLGVLHSFFKNILRCLINESVDFLGVALIDDLGKNLGASRLNDCL
jgi:hypothetical protein